MSEQLAGFNKTGQAPPPPPKKPGALTSQSTHFDNPIILLPDGRPLRVKDIRTMGEPILRKDCSKTILKIDLCDPIDVIEGDDIVVQNFIEAVFDSPEDAAQFVVTFLYLTGAPVFNFRGQRVAVTL